MDRPELETLREAATLLMVKLATWKNTTTEERNVLAPLLHFLNFDPDPSRNRWKMFYYKEGYARWIEGWLRKMEETEKDLLFRPKDGESPNTIECKISQGILWLQDHGGVNEWLAGLRPLIQVTQTDEGVRIRWKSGTFKIHDGELVKRKIDTTPVDKAEWKLEFIQFVENAEEGEVLDLKEHEDGKRYYFSAEAQEWIKEYIGQEVIKDEFYIIHCKERQVKIAKSRELVQMKKDGQI